jgi:hypothetical protein
MKPNEQFKYDVRVRERMLRRGLVTDSEVEKHLGEVPDSDGKYDSLVLAQPALGRREDALPTPPPETRFGSGTPAATPAAVAPAVAAPFASADDDDDLDDEDDDDLDDEDEDEDDEDLDAAGVPQPFEAPLSASATPAEAAPPTHIDEEAARQYKPEGEGNQAAATPDTDDAADGADAASTEDDDAAGSEEDADDDDDAGAGGGEEP